MAVIPGDGVGPEIAEICQPALVAAAARHQVHLETSVLDWGGERYLREGAAMPADGATQLRAYDAALFGAVGRPDIPDHELVWGLIIKLRQELGLSVNLRPARSFPGYLRRTAETLGSAGGRAVRDRSSTSGPDPRRGALYC
ncbi:tartrate dehydrogenase [mine drainage metagenome]|uniref:Tartrate dehydrogenase n=1 Tax=mine drainage metagenome TaxID=410659 RepID=T1AKV7_9ZZZZ